MKLRLQPCAISCQRISTTHLVPSEVLLDVPEPAEDPDVEQEQRHEGDDPRSDRPDPVGVHDDVGRVEAQAEIMKGLGPIVIQYVVGLMTGYNYSVSIFQESLLY